MNIEIDSETIARKIADALRPFFRSLLNERFEAIVQGAVGTDSHPRASPGEATSAVEGIRPHKLYPVSFVAERWQVSADNVRKKSNEELPRADWKGGEIRYRGRDILEYEGVDVSETAASPPPSPGSSGGEDPPITERSSSHSERDSVHSSEDRTLPDDDSRPYASGLPELEG